MNLISRIERLLQDNKQERERRQNSELMLIGVRQHHAAQEENILEVWIAMCLDTAFSSGMSPWFSELHSIQIDVRYVLPSNLISMTERRAGRCKQGIREKSCLDGFLSRKLTRTERACTQI